MTGKRNESLWCSAEWCEEWNESGKSIKEEMGYVVMLMRLQCQKWKDKFNLN